MMSTHNCNSLPVLTLPVTDRAHVDVHESLMRIISDPAFPQFKGRPSQYRSAVSGQSDIDRFSLDVIAVFCGAFAALTQLGVGFRAAVAGNYVKRFLRVEFY